MGRAVPRRPSVLTGTRPGGLRQHDADPTRRQWLRSALVAASLPAWPILASCSTDAAAGAAPGAAAPARGQVPRPLALALGSGALHGHALVGVMRVFEARGKRPDLIVGTSVGAIVGALWAAGLDAARIERESESFGLWSTAQFGWPRRGLLRNDGLQQRVRELVGGRPIESWPIPFAAVATDVDTGERVILDRGDAGSAVAASACMPVLFEPVERDGRHLVDGALSEPVPVRAARWLGGVRVVAVDIAFRPHDEPVQGTVDTGFQIFHILINALIAEQIGEADVRVQLDLHGLMRGRSDYAGALRRAGEQATEKAWGAIAQ